MDWTLIPATEFSAHQNDWDRLNSAEVASPMLDARMVACALEIFASGSERCAIGKDSQGRTAAMLVGAQSGPLKFTLFQPSQCPLGALLKRADVSLAEMAGGLFAALPRTVQQIGLSQLDPALYARPAAEQSRLESLDYIETARIPLDGTFEDYWAARGKNLRQNMKKQRNRLDRDGVEVVLREVTEASEMADAVATYGRLESASWKSAKGTAVAPDNDQGRFYTRLMETFAASGQARVVMLEFDGEVVACDLCVEGFGTIVILKTTYDERFSRFSPAMLMREQWFPSLFAREDLHMLEFYGRVMEWHRKWSDDIRVLYHLNVWRNGWLPALLKRLRKNG